MECWRRSAYTHSLCPTARRRKTPPTTTCGRRQRNLLPATGAFGKEEIEVLDTQAAPGDLHSFLLDLASYVLEEDVTFHDGETIGFTEGQYLPISRSAGVWHDGMTLKIPYPEEP